MTKNKFPDGVTRIRCDLIDIDNIRVIKKQVLDLNAVFHCAGELNDENLMRLLHVTGI